MCSQAGEFVDSLRIVEFLVDDVGQLGGLFGGWLARQREDVEFLDDLFGRLLRGEQVRNQLAAGDLQRDRVAVDEVQGLREVRFFIDLARAGRFARCSAERREEKVRDVAGVDLHGSRSLRRRLETVLGAGDARDRVEQHFGLQAADVAV